MRKSKLMCVSALLCGSIMFSSCIGSYGLFNKVLSWNKEVTKSKFVNEVVFLAMWIVPVYEISAFADTIIFNSVEFWSGKNPMMAKVGEVKEVQGEKGLYAIRTNRNGYTITNKTDNTSFDLVYSQKKNTWSVKHGNENADLIHFNEDGTIDMMLQNGDKINVSQDEQGLQQARQAAMGVYFAKR